LVGLKKLKYLAPIWTDPDENEFKRLLVANDIRRRVLKWLEGSVAPVETITLAPGQSWPDIEKMNAKCPQSEWHEAFGKMQGPWQGEHTVLFFDPETMVCYWWPSPLTTVGSAICVRELQAQVKLMRSYKGQYVFPLVELSHTYMPTAYGGRERPHLVIKDWVRFGDGGNVALPAPKTSTLTGSAKATVESKPAATSNPAGMQSVGKLTAKEIIQDSIEF
jgi:hypothetical protein